MITSFYTARKPDAAASDRRRICKPKHALFSEPYATAAGRLSLCYDVLLVRHPR